MPSDNASSPLSANNAFIGFPPPLLGAEPLRLPLLLAEAGLLALNLPGAMASDAHPLNPAGAKLVAHALREQLAAGKPELQRLGVEVIQSISYLEPECSGVALYATSRAATELWRNVYGSRQMGFRFLLVCEGAPNLPDELSCDLPIAPHRDGGRMLVSHKSGKKTHTVFRRLAVGKETMEEKRNLLPAKALWEAVTDFPRPHQIRLHAFEAGLRLCGEALYATVPPLYLSDSKGLRRRPPAEEPLLNGPALHLAGITLPAAAFDAAPAAVAYRGGAVEVKADGALIEVRADAPRPLATVLRLLFGEQAKG